MKSLVTGGAGFIGSHIVDALIARGHDVHVLDDLSGGFLSNVNPRATFTESSILDDKLVEWLFNAQRFDYVFHCAAYAAENLSHHIRRFNYLNNVVGSMNLINASIRYGVKCFVFTSSIAVYGAGQVPFREDMTPHPEDPYGIAKYAVELDLAAAHRHFGLPYIIFRPHNVYGERQNINDPYRNVIGIFMRQAMRGEPLTVFGEGNQTRAFTYIGEVACEIARSVDLPLARNEIFNIGAENAYTVDYVASLVQKYIRPTPIIHLPARKEVKHAFSEHYHMAAIFGGTFHESLHLGIERMAAWAKTCNMIQSTLPDPEISAPEWALKATSCPTHK